MAGKGGAPDTETIIFVRVRGGDASGTASLAPKVGPLGLSPKKIGDDIAASTKDWKGLKVMCKLTIKNRKADVEVCPTAANFLIKELKEPFVEKKNRPEGGIRHTGNLKWDQIIAVSKTLRSRSMARTFKGTVKETVGTAGSIGCTIDGKPAKQVMKELESGSYDDRIPEVA
eukprot:TRINITY_DN1836_c0_g1_i1.p1 TRINITY_DN1836_c0_g1~~TRINITY_DN1836_c0_g1_i1.p1  ORF type:complete len:172 (-),score=40.48 TRINITY_DN1836_c0_g1_i1:98-613(-)